MPIKQNSAEGGTNGTNVTTANSGGGSGTAFDLISFGSGSIKYDAASAVHGALGFLFSPASGAQCLARWTGFNDLIGTVRTYLKNAPSLPTANEALFGVYTSGGTRILSFAISTANKYTMVDGAGSSVTQFTTTAVCQAGDRIELTWTVGASSTTGSYSFALYRGDSTTAVETKTGSAANFGTTNWGYIDWGKTSTSTWVPGNLAYDDFAAKDASSTFFGVPSSPPTPAFTADVWGQTVLFDATSSAAVPPATIASYSWNFGDGGTATGATPSHNYAAPGSYNVQLTVVDSGSNSANVTNTVVAVAPKGSVAPIYVTTAWTPTPGGSTPVAVLADTDPATFITSPNAPSGSPVEVWYEAMTPPTAGQGVTFSCLFDRLNSASGSVSAQLWDKNTNTLISTVSGQTVAAGSGTSVATPPMIFAFPSSDVTSMSAMGWNKPKVIYSGTAA